ncbi:MAG TPA: PKD domain-containing protein [Limnochordia bacterium]|nr:PKD domain-containing protein [Limnochordia bacterium]
MSARRSLFLLVLLCCALVLQGCGGGGGNKAPRITAYSPQKNYAVVKDGQVQFSVTASDPENDSLVYNWQSTAGSFVGAANSNTVTWKAPSEPGTCTVTVTVRDAKGNTTSHTFYFTVKGSVEFVDEDITQSKTWAAGNIYVINSRDINVTGTLKIEAGAIVKFGEGYSLRTSGSGRIEAVGTEAKPVIFTSFHDDLHGGDTNQNQNATGPFAGDWVGISLAGSRNGNKFVYCEFYYGGAGYAGSMLDLDGTTGTQVENCTFAFSAGIGLDATSAQNPVIKGNVFYHNEKPLVINVDTNLDDSNTFHNPQAPNEKNTYQGIFVNPAAGSTFSKTTSWAESEAAFVLDGNQWHIEPGGKADLGARCHGKIHRPQLPCCKG